MADEFQMRVTELPPDMRGTKNGVNLMYEVYAFVTQHPGQWCEIWRGKKNTLTSRVYRFKASRYAAGCELVNRENPDGTSSVYCRYTPPPAKS